MKGYVSSLSEVYNQILNPHIYPLLKLRQNIIIIIIIYVIEKLFNNILVNQEKSYLRNL